MTSEQGTNSVMLTFITVHQNYSQGQDFFSYCRQKDGTWVFESKTIHLCCGIPHANRGS